MKEESKYELMKQYLILLQNINLSLKMPIKLGNKNLYDLQEIVENILKGYEIEEEDG